MYLALQMSAESNQDVVEGRPSSLHRQQQLFTSSLDWVFNFALTNWQLNILFLVGENG